jgi:hypothetical protein
MTETLVKVHTYKSIDDLPIWNFDILCKTRNYQYLLHDEFAEFPEDIDADELWTRIYDHYLEVYGLGEDYKEWCKLMRKASNAIGDVYLKGQKWKITHAEIYRQMADKLISNVEAGDLSVTCASLSKYNGFRINPAEISVREFNSYLEIAKKASKNG